MKTEIILHMMSSIDGRIVTSGWPEAFDIGELYEDIHTQLKGDSWIVGPTTMAEFANGAPAPVTANKAFPRETWKAPGSEKGPYAIALDRKGKLHLNLNSVNGDPLLYVLTESVQDDFLAELQRDGISYVFAGTDDIDLPLAVKKLSDEFAINRLLLEGGGGVNGAFLDAGLIDKISLVLLPFADGKVNSPTLFERAASAATLLKLQSVSQLDNDVLHLMYSLK
ncbi:RibD family protein [Pantoea sp.]|uniref:RibD family protein n=1 Tax=Pantoea sp. TaxID=69393 RepID=UPI0028A5B377|nr:RibD family protein [Pantoea sp.]